MSAVIGKKIDEIAALIKQKEVLDTKSNALDVQIKAKQEALLSKIKKQELDGALGKLGKAVVDEEDVPTIEDWPKFYKYIKKTGEFDLLQKRLGKQAIELRWADGKKVPGVGKFHRVALRVVLNKPKRK